MRKKSGLGRRLTVLAAATMVFTGATATVAAPAQATPADCVAVLAAAGYSGLEFSAACLLGGINYSLCNVTLTLLSVPPVLADTACRAAAL